MCSITQLVMNICPASSQSSPNGLVVPQAYGSNTWRVGWYRQTPQSNGTRSLSGVPGLPTRERDWMPLHPYSQPSGPHESELKTLCLVSFRFQPSSSTCGGPAGLSSPGLTGMKMKFGSEQSHTPPKPSSMPDRFD